MQDSSGSLDDNTYQCIDCGTRARLPETIEERPSEFLIVRGGQPTERIVTVAGNIVHRCASPFVTLTL